MTNITLSIDDNVYNKMKKYSEIKWSEFVRKVIEIRIGQLEKIKEQSWENPKFMADEKLLAKSWLSKEDDKAFAYLQ